MKQETKSYILLALLFGLLVTVLLLKPEPVDWRPTFSSRDKVPFGSRAVVNCLEDIFPGNPVTVLRIPPSESAGKIQAVAPSDSRPVNYLFVQSDFSPGRQDALSLLNLAEKGHNVFVSARSVSGLFADTLGVSIEPRAFDPAAVFKGKSDTLLLTLSGSDQAFAMKPGDNDMQVVCRDEKLFSVLGRASDSVPVFVSRKWGEGRIFIHSVPLAFTNYYLLFQDNAEYVSRCFSFMPNGPVLWDEYYKQGREEAVTPLRVILANPPLRAALWVLFIFTLIYIVFQSKRRQRVIPVIEPLANTTLQFVSTVAALYRSRADHAAIARKQVFFLSERIRMRYRINPDFSSSASVAELAAVSGAEHDLVKELFARCLYFMSAEHISEKELLEFNRLLNRFLQQSS